MPSKKMLFSAIGYTMGCALQIVALVRYVSRMPDDWVGIVIYSLTLVLFAAAAVVTYVQWSLNR